MKKATALFCLLLIMISMMPAATAAPEDKLLFTEEQLSELQVQRYSDPTMAAIGDTLYSLWGSKIFSWKAGQETPDAVASGLEPNIYESYAEAQELADDAEAVIAYLVSDGTTLYGLNRLNGKLFPITFESDKLILGTPVQLDWSDMEYKGNSIIYSKMTERLYIVENRLYIIVRSAGKMYNPEFVSFDLATGEKQVLNVPLVQDMTPYKDGKLLLKVCDMDNAYKEGKLDSIKPAVAIFDPADGSCREAGVIVDAAVYGMVYHKETDSLFYATSDKLMCMKSFGTATQVASIPANFPDYTSPALMLPGGIYAIATCSGLVMRGTGAQYTPPGSLSIYGGCTDSATLAFMEKYPEVPVVFSEDLFFENDQALAQAMITGDHSFDVYNLDISYQDFVSLMEKGYCMDLSSSPVLAAELARMYPFLQSAISRDGKFYALPIIINGYGLSIVPKTWEESGLTSRMPGSFLELIDFMNWWAEEGHIQHPEIQLMEDVTDFRKTMFQMALDLYVHQSQANHEELSFDTPLFRTIMQALEGLKAEELNNIMPSDPEKSMNTAGLFRNYGDWLKVQGGLRSLMTSKPLMLPIQSGGPVYIPVNVQVLFINPNTKNPDTALKYLESALEYMDPAQHIMMFPDDNEPVPQENFEQTVQQWTVELESEKKRLETAKPEEKKDIETSIQTYEELLAQKDMHYWLVAPENISQYRQVAPQCYVAMPNVLDYRAQEGTSEIMTLVDRYRQKQMSLDQFIAEVDQKIRMITLERQ